MKNRKEKTMKIYNSKTLKIEEFVPINEKEVLMYVCGPTVYGDAHIGNARPIIVFDTLKRVLEANNYKVKYVSNYTDVDDKIINKAKEENVSEQVISERYIEAYNKVRTALNANNLLATPKVTETIDDIIKFIEDLVTNGYAYEVDGDVYFRVNKVDEYGNLSKQNIEDLKTGARIESNNKKENPMDFALWKKTDHGIKWDSKFSKGRPGWHTECVVMINSKLGNKIDIHGGGSDLKFPHHENEVAQSLAINHNDIANYWVHNAMINIDGDKMSKSLGNIKNAKDVIKELGATLVRFFMLSVNYRKEISFNDESIATAKKELDKITNCLKQTSILLQRNKIDYNMLSANNNESYKEFLEQMNDDMNTPNAYMIIYQIVKKINQLVRVKELDLNEIKSNFEALLLALDVLGILIPLPNLTNEDINLLSNWDLAKKEKDFEKADLYRNQLIEKGII